MARKSLMARSQGPRAMPLDTLVQRAETVAAQVNLDYGAYVLENIRDVGAIADALDGGAGDVARHDALARAVGDLRTSAGMAQSAWVAKFSAALERALSAHQPPDPKIPLLVALHLDAIKIAAQGKAPPQALDHLEDELRRVVAALG